MPVFTNNIPQPGDQPSQSQDQILENFQTMNTAFSQDHAPYNAATQGQHNQITFPVGPITGQPFTYLLGQIGLQNYNAAPTSRPDIWMARGTATSFPITGYAIDGTGKSGWTYLPSGVLFAWGYVTIPSGSTITVTYISADTSGGAGVTFPGFATMGTPQVTGGTSTGILVSAYTRTNFTVTSTNASGTFIWHAIGI